MNLYFLIKITGWLKMAKVTLKNLSHSYLAKQQRDSDFVLTNINIDWNDGGAYALLGPSGCCLLYTSPSPRDVEESRMPSSA